MINKTSQDVRMQSRTPSRRNKRRLTQWIASISGSVSITTLCTLLTFAIVLPRLGVNDPSIPFKPVNPTQPNSALPPSTSVRARPVAVVQRKVLGVPIYVTTIDLTDPKTFIGVGLANNAERANRAKATRGDETFNSMVRRFRAALTASGTFFSMDAEKRVMGNMVSGGRFLKYSPWENYGTTLGIRAGNQPEMVTARTEGKPQWEKHWFSLTAGPRLLKQGEVSINAKAEGFTDSAVMQGTAIRSAIGFPKQGKKLLMVTFQKPVSLKTEAAIMRALGCHEAMNLDGGTSLALANGNRILHPAGRELTNVITVYDTQYPAPESLRQSWANFQKADLAMNPPPP
jgi:Phosphodiester glycosidase